LRGTGIFASSPRRSSWSFASWLIAFVEYCLAVPANRWGNAVLTTAELKTIQEVITLLIFAGFSVLYLKSPLRWNHALGFAMIAGGRVLRIPEVVSWLPLEWNEKAGVPRHGFP
jgi:uncharacterized protein (DUF486 family)